MWLQQGKLSFPSFLQEVFFQKKRHTNNLNKLCPYKHGEIFLENKES